MDAVAFAQPASALKLTQLLSRSKHDFPVHLSFCLPMAVDVLILIAPMKNKNQITSILLRIAAPLFLLLFLLSCGKRDDRSDVRAQRGEPDEIQTVGKDPFWYEQWFYNEAGVGYEFRRTSGCGSVQDVYLYIVFPYTPPDDSTTTSLSRPQSTPQEYESRQSPLSPF